MNIFLSSIKVFGYLDKQSFHELAKHLHTKKLEKDDYLFDENTESRDFYIVIDGCVQVYLKSTNLTDEDEEDAEFSDDDDKEEDLLLNELYSGGTVSSLFNILSIFTEDLSSNSDDKLSNKNNNKSESTEDTFKVNNNNNNTTRIIYKII